MEKAKVIELKETILEDNNADAQVLRQELKAQKTCLMNLMSSPGSGNGMYEKCGSELERPYPSPKGKKKAYKLGEIVFLMGGSRRGT